MELQTGASYDLDRCKYGTGELAKWYETELGAALEPGAADATCDEDRLTCKLDTTVYQPVCEGEEVGGQLLTFTIENNCVNGSWNKLEGMAGCADGTSCDLSTGELGA